MTTPAPDPEPFAPRPRRAWGKKLEPETLRAVFQDYDRGITGKQLCEKYDISRSTLYRWIAEYEKAPQEEKSVTFLKAELARHKELVALLTMKLWEAQNDGQVSAGTDDPDGPVHDCHGQPAASA